MHRWILATAVSIALLIMASMAALATRSAGGAAVVSHPAKAALARANDMSASSKPRFGFPTPVSGAAVTAVATAPGVTELVSALPGATYIPYWPDPSQPVVGDLSATTWGGPTVSPVIATMGDYLEIRLGTRPNGSTAWVRKEDVTTSTTPYRIVISVSQRRLTLLENGSLVYSAPVGVGQAQWATPLGPSFVTAEVVTPANQRYIYGPLVIMTGTHSDVFTTFDGGDGTVGIHGYPSDPASTMGVASSHGCIRANPATISTLSEVPVGTPIDFDA